MAEKKKKDLPKRTLIVTQLSEISRGESDHGEWVLHGVKATDTDGTPVEHELRTFKGDECKIGEPLVYELERKEHEKYGVQYMVYPPRKDMKKSLDELRGRVDALEHEVGQLKRLITAAPAAAPAPAEQTPRRESEAKPAEEPPPLGASRGPMNPKPNQQQGRPDDDIPF